MPESTLAAYWPKIIKLVKFLVRKRAVADAEDMVSGSPSNPKGPDLEAPYDQIINSTDFLKFIHMVEHGRTGDLLTAQGILRSDFSCCTGHCLCSGLSKSVAAPTAALHIQHS